MELTHYGHACVQADLQIGLGTARVLFDPGVLSRDYETVNGIDVVLITRAHHAELDLERLRALLSNNPYAEVVAGIEAMAALADVRKALGDRIQVVAPGDKLSLRGIDVVVTGGSSDAGVYPALSGSVNPGYLVNGRLLRPGDAIDGISRGVEVLLLPIGGLCMKIGESVDYLRAVSPRVAVPIHPAGLDAEQLSLRYRLLRNGAPAETEIVVLEHGVPQNVFNPGHG